MDREWGAPDALAFVRRTDFAPSDVAFDAAMQQGRRVSGGIGVQPGWRRRRRGARDRRRHARLRVHGQGARERLQDAAVHDVAAAAAAAARLDRGPRRGGGHRGGRAATASSAPSPTGASSSPIRRSSSSTTAGRTTCTPSRRSRRPRPASTSSARSRSGGRAEESYEIWQRVEAAGVKHMTAFNYRFVPAVRLARELIEAGELGEIYHFRGRYLQEWGDDHGRRVAVPPRRGRLGRARRPRRARDRPRPLPRRRDLDGVGLAADVHAGPRGRRRLRGGGRVRERRRRHDRGDPLRARAQERVRWEINGSKGSIAFDLERLNELARVRRGRKGSGRVLVSEADHPFLRWWWPHGPHHRLGAHVRPRDPPPARGDRDRRRRRRRTARRSRTATAPPRSATRSCARPRPAAARSWPIAVEASG